MAEQEEGQHVDDSGSDVLFDFYCEICREDGQMFEAEGYCVNCKEYLCITCYTHHRRSRGSRHHVLMDKVTMPKDTPLFQDQVSKDISKMCDHHAEEPVKYYCKSHDCLRCHNCIIESHRNCSNIENIAKVSESIMESQEFKSFIVMLNQFDQRSRIYIQLVKENISKSKKWCAEVAKSLQKFKAEVSSILDELETSIITQAEDLQKEEEKKLVDVSDNINTCLESVENMFGEFDYLQKSSKVCEIYIKLKESKKEAREIQTKLTEAQRENSISGYVFDPYSTKFKEFLNSKKGFGNLFVKGLVSSVAMALPHSYHVNTMATHVADIDVESSKDEQDWCITGSATVSNNRLAIVDNSNSKVKLLDTQSNKVISELKVSDYSQDITCIGKHQIAVSEYGGKKLLLLSVSNTLTLDREILVNGECYGVAYSKNRLVVTYVNPGKLEIMDLSGKVVKRVMHDSDGERLFDRPEYVCVSNNGEIIYVSDCDAHKVISLTSNGTVKSVYSNSELRAPQKVCVDHNDNVYVCGCDSFNIHILTADLTKIKIILTYAQGRYGYLYTVSHCQETNTLYVGMGNKTIKVYQLSQ